MSIKFFDITMPVRVREHDEGSGRMSEQRLTVRITMGPGATARDAVEEFARKLEQSCTTIDIGDCT